MLSNFLRRICRIGLSDNFSTNLLQLLNIENVKEAYCTSNGVQYEKQMLWYNDRHTGIAYMVLVLEHLALSRMYNHDTARVLGLKTYNETLLSITVARLEGRGQKVVWHAFRTNCRPSQNLAPQIQVPVWNQRVDQGIQQTRVAERARGFKSLSLSESPTRFSIPEILTLFCDYVEELRGKCRPRGSSTEEKLTQNPR